MQDQEKCKTVLIAMYMLCELPIQAAYTQYMKRTQNGYSARSHPPQLISPQCNAITNEQRPSAVLLCNDALLPAAVRFHNYTQT